MIHLRAPKSLGYKKAFIWFFTSFINDVLLYGVCCGFQPDWCQETWKIGRPAQVFACTDVDVLRWPATRSPIFTISAVITSPLDTSFLFIRWSSASHIVLRYLAVRTFAACYRLYALAVLDAHSTPYCTWSIITLRFSLCFSFGLCLISAPRWFRFAGPFSVPCYAHPWFLLLYCRRAQAEVGHMSENRFGLLAAHQVSYEHL